MKAHRAIVAALAFCAVAPASAAVRLAPPRGRIAREVLLYWAVSQRAERIAEPGHHEFEFALAAEGEGTVKVQVVVTREPVPGRERDAAYPERTTAQVLEIASEGKAAQVRFSDAFREGDVGARDQPVPVQLPDGQRIPICHSFVTEAGITCLVPEGAADLQLVRAAMAGDVLTMRGQVFGVQDLGPCVVIDGVKFAGDEHAADEPPWAVRVLGGGRDVSLGSEPGDYTVRIPRGDGQGEGNALLVRQRQFKVVDLEANGHKIVAELAASPRETSYGLQGRRGLETDHGMLFFFARPGHPVFVMKTVSFPISIAFIRADGIVTNIGRMNPGDQRGVTSVVPVNYVLEMEQDWFEEHEVKPGDRLTMP